MITNTSDTITRVPPQNIEAEVAVLGSMLLDKDAASEVVTLLRAEDFYRTAHAVLFEAMVRVYDEKASIDLVVLRDDLSQRDQLEKVGGEDYIAYLANAVPSAANAEHYAGIVRDHALKRDIITKAHEMVKEAYESSTDAREILDHAETMLFGLNREDGTSGPSSISEVLKDTMAGIDRTQQGHLTGVPTGFFELDDITCGLQPGELVVVAGRPSMGKTTFSLNLAEYAALEENAPVAIFSLEMAKKQLVQNMLCSRARVNAHSVRKGILAEAEWNSITQTLGPLSESPIFIDDTPALTPTQLRAKARRLKARYGIKLIIADYLQLMEAPRAENRQQEISVISRSFKALARELNLPIIAISQLNRSVDAREDHRPRMSDLRESGAIEQDADLIMFLFREEYYEQREDNRNLAELIVAKQRNGPTGVVKLMFEARWMRFENLSFDVER
jgi:replicative DNA helicase